MPYHCVAYGCGKTVEDGVTLFRFPKDPDEFRKWEKQGNSKRLSSPCNQYTLVCKTYSHPLNFSIF
uniref:THAP-type domain-containing protein n=1 Tax=Poecilia reticulata TaxID=8081 RepID=A0A3P9QAH8_POERE